MLESSSLPLILIQHISNVLRGDGTTSSETSTGVVVAASTEYLLTVDWSVHGTLTCTVVKLSSPPVTTIVTKSTNLDAGATALYLQNTVTTYNTTAKNLGIALTQLEQD